MRWWEWLIVLVALGGIGGVWYSAVHGRTKLPPTDGDDTTRIVPPKLIP